MSSCARGVCGSSHASPSKKIVRSTGALESSLTLARRYADTAAGALAHLGPKAAALAGFAHAILDDLG